MDKSARIFQEHINWLIQAKAVYGQLEHKPLGEDTIISVPLMGLGDILVYDDGRTHYLYMPISVLTLEEEREKWLKAVDSGNLSPQKVPVLI